MFDVSWNFTSPDLLRVRWGVHPKILLPTGGVDSFLAAVLAVFRIVPVVAPLAECGEVH